MSEGGQRSPRRGMCAAVLALEGIVVALSTPVMITISEVPRTAALLLGLGVALACLLLAGMLRSEAGYVGGWVVQVGAIGLGFLVPPMFLLGGIFSALWATAYLLGLRIERERAAAYAAWSDGAAEPGEQPG